jgi:hypothetical protein
MINFAEKEHNGQSSYPPATPGVGMRFATTGKPSDIAATSGYLEQSYAEN